MPDTSVSPCMPLVPEPKESESEQVSPCVGSLRGTAWGESSLLQILNLCWFLQPEVMETSLPRTGILGWGSWCGLQPLVPQIALLDFYPCGCDASLFHVYSPSTSLDGCGFFNFVVVSPPFNSFSDVPE